MQPINSKKVPERSKSPEWDGKRLKDRKSELKAAGKSEGRKQNDFTKRLSEEAGISVREVSRRIKDYDEKLSSPMSHIQKKLSAS